MFNHFLAFLLLSLFINVNALANNPFAKSESMEIGKEINWKYEKEAGVATKSIAGEKGTYYHLRFDNTRLELLISRDAGGLLVKQFDQLDIKDVEIDGKRSALFSWCLNNQESQDRFLQQGLKVKNNVCVSDGSKGSFIMQLDGGTLSSLKNGRELLIVLKPYRTPLELHYDLSDFKKMYSELNAKPSPVTASISPASAASISATEQKKSCLANPPAGYKSISAIEYDCADAAAKQAADNKINNAVKQQKDIEAKQRKIAEDKRRQEQAAAEAAKLKQEEKIKLEAAAIAASEAKQAEIGGEITQKMVTMCEKYWSKGEHRCYCEKYIEYAPSEIQANSTCQ